MAYTMPLGFADLPTIYNLDSGVGPGRANLYEDVWIVQRLIQIANFTMLSGGVPTHGSSIIQVDGFCGPETLRMIAAFQDDQARNGKLIGRDGGLDPSPPDGYTKGGILYGIVHLNRAARRRDESLYLDIPFDVKTPRPCAPGSPPAPRNGRGRSRASSSKGRTARRPTAAAPAAGFVTLRDQRQSRPRASD